MSATRNQFSLPGEASREGFPALRTACATKLLPLLLLLALPAVVQAGFTFTTNNGAITIIYPSCLAGAVTIPSKTNGLPVTNIGGSGIYGAFYNCATLTSVTIPNSVTNIGYDAFAECYSLTNVTMGSGVTSIGEAAFAATPLTSVTIGTNVTTIGYEAFYGCSFLTNVTIGSRVTSIGVEAFQLCYGLTSITNPCSVTSIGDRAFSDCISVTGLTEVYFKGNAPSVGTDVFYGDPATAYYLPGTTGWAAFSVNTSIPALLWNPQVQTSGASFGVRTNRFGFNITGNSGLVVVVEACTNLANPTWSPLQTITLTGSPAYFSDSQWTNHTRRFYGLGVP